MVITENLLYKYFNFKDSLDIIYAAFEQLGFFAYKTENQFCLTISVEIPTSRPDCNSIYGLVRELKSIVPNLTLPSFEISDWLKYDSHSCEFAAVTLCYESIVVSGIMIEALKANGLFSDNEILNFANFQMLMFGNPVIFFYHTDKFIIKVLEEDVIIDNNKFFKGTPIIFAGENHFPWLPLKTRLSSYDNINNKDKITFLSVYFPTQDIKKIIDLYSNIDFNKYYYYIRNSNSHDSLMSVMSIKEGMEPHYFINHVEMNLIPLSHEEIVNTLGINLEREVINKALQSLNYKITYDEISAPLYRKDIVNSKNVVFDIMRICFSQFTTQSNTENIDKATMINAVDDIITGLSFAGYSEIISNPFVSKKDIEYNYNGKEKHLPIKILNKQKNDKIYCPMTLRIGIMKKLNAKNHKLFERGQLKYKNINGNLETRDVICIGETNDGNLSGFINIIRQIQFNIKQKLTLYNFHSDDNYYWELWAGDLWVANIIYIVKNNGKNIVTLFEFATDIIENIKICILNTDIDYMTRDISIDIDISTCFIDVINNIVNIDTENIVYDIIVMSADIISKSNNIVINYKLRLIYFKTTKEAIRKLNEKIYIEMHYQGSLL